MRRRTAGAAAGLTALLALTACNGGEPTTTEPTSSPTPTETTSAPADPKEQAVTDATAALQRYFEMVDQLAQNPKMPLEKNLKKVVTSSGYSLTWTVLNQGRRKGYTQHGETTFEVDKVLEVSLDNSNPKKGVAPTVQLQVCYDVSNVDVVDKSGASVVSDDRLDKAIATYWVSNYDYKSDPRGGWIVSGRQARGDRTC